MNEETCVAAVPRPDVHAGVHCCRRLQQHRWMVSVAGWACYPSPSTTLIRVSGSQAALLR
jgi:hypothetical protein